MALYQSGSGLGALVGVGTTNPTSNLQVYGTPIAAGNVFSVLNTAASGNVAQFSSSAGTALIINSSGNVGIGTTSPSAQLHLNGPGQATNTAFSTTGNLGGSIILQDSGASAYNGGALVFGASQGYFAAIKGAIQDGTTNTRGDLYFATRNAIADTTLATRMTITSGGNVGIGITNPGSALQVVGTVTATTFSGAGTSLTGTAASLTAGNATTAVNQSGGTVSCTSAYSSGYFGTSVVPGVATRSTGGFYVYNDGNFNIEMMQRTAGVYGLNFITRNTDGVFSWRKTGGVSDWGTELMFLNNAGNLGIGTGSPACTFHMYTGQAGAPATSGSSDPNIAHRIHVASIGVDTGVYGGGYAWIQPRLATNYASNYGMTLCPNGGNVGIGTTNPGYPLDVNGAIRSSRLAMVGFTNIVNRRPIWGVGGSATQAYFQTASTTDVSFFLVNQYGPFSYAVPAVGTGATRKYRLYVVYVDNFEGGSGWNIDFVLTGGTTVSFNLPLTWGGLGWRRDAYSTNTVNDPVNSNHGVINVRFNITGAVVNPAYVNIEYVELQAIDQY